MSQIKMVPRTTKSCNAEFVLPVPADSDGYDTLAGKKGAHLSDAIDKAIYHSWNSKFRGPFVDALVAKTGVAIPGSGKTRKVKDDDGNEVTEEIPISEVLFTKQLLANNKLTQGELNAIAQEVADTIPFAKAFEGGRVKTPSKNATAKAQGIIAACAAGQASLANVVAKLLSLNPGMVLADEPSEEELAFAIMADDERRSREAQNDLLG